MKKILFVSLLTTAFFACGPSSEEMDAHAKKVAEEELKLPDDFEKQMEQMGMMADSTIASDSTSADSTNH
ncbi:MAG: hypothetical protein ACKOXB_06635 [Flavobacteriales bacterium]